MNKPRKLLGNFLAVLVVGIPLLIIISLVFIITLLGVARDSIPDKYNDKMSERLGLGCSMNYTLSEEDAEEHGLSTDLVANAAAASNWCLGKFNTPIDLGILLAIFEKETGNGAYFGECSGLKSAKEYGGGQLRYAKGLLAYWKKHDTRSRSSAAAAHIKPDYSDYTGHCTAGEIGSGFIPRSAHIICMRELSKSGDADLAACDFWSTKVAFHSISYWLYRIDYRADLTEEEKLDKLIGWNRSKSFREDLLTRASEYNEILGYVDFNSTRITFNEEWGESLSGTAKLSTFWFLRDFGLLPEVMGWLKTPLDPEDIVRISQRWMETTYDKQGHPGIDFSCFSGAPVLAVADGIVIQPAPFSVGSLEGFGKTVWLYHGNDIYTLAAHLSRVDVDIGQTVKQGQKVGLCGSTGFSTGPHVHFGVANQHPDDFKSYRDQNPGWEDPNLYLGTCGIQSE